MIHLLYRLVVLQQTILYDAKVVCSIKENLIASSKVEMQKDLMQIEKGWGREGGTMENHKDSF